MDFISIVLMGLLTFYALILLMKLAGAEQKCTCPDCKGNRLKPRKMGAIEKSLNLISLDILPVQRHICEDCGWEGIHWRIAL